MVLCQRASLSPGYYRLQVIGYRLGPELLLPVEEFKYPGVFFMSYQSLFLFCLHSQNSDLDKDGLVFPSTCFQISLLLILYVQHQNKTY